MDGEESKIKYDDEQSPTPMVIILPMLNIVLIASTMKKITHLVGKRKFLKSLYERGVVMKKKNYWLKQSDSKFLRTLKKNRRRVRPKRNMR